MIPKEKAIELLDKYKSGFWLSELGAKQCAIIAVDEMLFQINELILVYGELNGTEFSIGLDLIIYWQQVKQEIEKL